MLRQTSKMIVQCDNCRTKFRLDDSRVGTRGVKVRCSRCAHVFHVPTTQDASPAGRIEAQLVDPTASERPMSPLPPMPSSSIASDLVLGGGAEQGSSSFLKGLSGGDIDWSKHPSAPPGAGPAPGSLFGSWAPPSNPPGAFGPPSHPPPKAPPRAEPARGSTRLDPPRPIERADTIREPRKTGARPPNGRQDIVRPALPSFEPPTQRASVPPSAHHELDPFGSNPRAPSATAVGSLLPSQSAHGPPPIRPPEPPPAPIPSSSQLGPPPGAHGQFSPPASSSGPFPSPFGSGQFPTGFANPQSGQVKPGSGPFPSPIGKPGTGSGPFQSPFAPPKPGSGPFPSPFAGPVIPAGQRAQTPQPSPPPAIQSPTFPPPPVFDPFSDPLTQQSRNPASMPPPLMGDPFEQPSRPSNDPFSGELQHPQDFLVGGSAARSFDPSALDEDEENGIGLAKIDLKRGLMGRAGTPSVLGTVNDVETRIAPARGGVEPDEEAPRPRHTARTFVLLAVLLAVLAGSIALGEISPAPINEPAIFQTLGPKRAAILAAEALEDVRASRAGVALYPTKNGKSVLVVFGDASNHGDAALVDLEAVAFMLEGDRVVGKRSATVGAPLPVDQLVLVESEADLETAQARVAESAPANARMLAPGETREFMVVFPQYPGDLEHYTFRIEFKHKGDAIEAAGR